MRVSRVLAPVLALGLAATVIPSAGAAPGYPVQRDTYGVDANGLPALPESTVLATDGSGQVVVGGASDLFRMTTSGQLVQHTTPPTGVTSYATDPARNEAYSSYAGSNVVQVTRPDGTPLASDDLADLTGGSVPMHPVGLADDPSSPYWSQQVLGTPSGQPVVYALGPDLTPSSTRTVVDVIDPTVTSQAYPEQEILASFSVRSATQIVVAPDHSLYLADASAPVLDHYTQQGVFVGSVSLHDAAGATGLSSFSIDGAGTVFLPQPANHRIVEDSLDGAYLGTFGDQIDGSDPQQPGGFYGPTMTAADCRGVLWVLDTDSTAHKSRLVSFDGVAAPTGRCVTRPAVTNPVPLPHGGYTVATDRVGNVFVAEYGVIQKLDRTGHVLATWGNPRAAYTGSTTSPQAFGFPVGLAVTPGGDVLVTSSRFCAAWTTTGFCSAFTPYPSATDNPPQPRIVEFHSTGTWVRTLTKAPNGTAWRFLGPLAVRSDGHIFVTDNSDATAGISGVKPHTVQEYTSTWTSVRDLAVNPISTTATTTLSVRSLTFDASGDLLAGAQQTRADPASTTTPAQPITDYTGFEHLYDTRVLRWTSAGAPLSSFAGPSAAPGNASPPGAENTGDDSVVGLTVLHDGSQLWSVVQPNLYPHTGTGGLLQVTATGTVLGMYRDGFLGNDDAARTALDCGGDLVLLVNAGIRRMHVTTPTSCVWKPTAITGAVIARGTTALKVRGYCNPAAQVTRMRILYGATSAHGKYTAWITLPSDNVQLYRDITFSGLLALHTYHYAVQVTNASGTVTGADKLATTA